MQYWREAIIIGLVIAILYCTSGCAHSRSAETGCLASVPVNVLVEKDKIDLSNIKHWNCD